MAGEKRTQDREETLFAETTVLVDIEGTTTSISFVKDVLFPYVRQNLKEYIETKWEDDEFKQDYEKLKEQANKDKEDKLDGFLPIIGDNPEEEKESLLKNVFWQMDNDRKTGALKQLQGHIWREAYKTGAVKAHIYEDVPKAFESWTNNGRKIYVYSSGSVEAQKLLFGHSVHGDLLKYFSDFFDTEVGAKQERGSYENILTKIGEKASNVIFLTDVVKEAAAAKEAGLSTVIVIREGNASLTDEEKVKFTIAKSFLDVTFQIATKRPKLETAEEKIDESTSNVCEPMDISEDVDASDVNEKKTENNEVRKVVGSDETGHEKKVSSEDASKSLMKNEDPTMITKNSSKINQETPSAEGADTKSVDTSEKQDISESTEQVVTEDVATPTTKDGDQDAASKKTEKKLHPAEIPSAADDSIVVPVSECVSKSEIVSTSDKKIEESTETTKDIQTEVKKAQTTGNEKKADNADPQSQTDKNTLDKSEKCLTTENNDVKEESKTVSDALKDEEISTKSGQEEVTKTDATVADVTENGDTMEAATEKTTVGEMNATTSTADAKSETTPIEVSVEKSAEAIVECEKMDDKESQEVKKEETVLDDVKKCEDETMKQETTKETVTEENVVDVKDKNTVDSEKQKLNGTAQNGDTDVPVLDDKLHSNGLNGGPSKEKVNSPAGDEAAAQNGEPQSSSETSAESIKVKKVVDSTVADGAGESDVVPPVVVAATS